MGFLSFFKSKPTKKVIILGLDAVGKSKLLYRYKEGVSIETFPTNGFNVETITYGHTRYEFWDVGGGCMIKRLWCHYTADCFAVFFVVDAADRERLCCKDKKCGVLCVYCSWAIVVEDFLKMAAPPYVSILLNKCDCSNFIDEQELRQCLREILLDDIPIFKVSVVTGEGLDEPLQWLEELTKIKGF
ncbi:hypothetical protein P9112_003912 [Eukaryota sp. TZLM1-RC]